MFLTDALRYTGGAPERVMIDNTHVVVLRGTGREMIPVPEMEAFADRLGFRFVAHAIGNANRSARVERPFSFIENNFLAGRTFTSWEDLNSQARQWCDKVNSTYKKHIRAVPRELFAVERMHLKPLPAWIPDVYRLHQRTVDVEGYVSVNSIRYSVPVAWIGHRVEVRETRDKIEIEMDARHMWESFFGFKKTPFGDSPDAKQLFASQTWNQVKTRLEFLAQHHGAGLIAGEVGAGKSTAARVFTATLNTNLYKILYVHFSSGSALDLLRQIALELDLEPAHFRGDLVRQISGAIVRLNQKKQHPILICDEAHLLPHPALEQLPLLLNFDMDSSRYLTLLLVGQPLLRRTLSLQMHEALRQRIGVQYQLEGLTRDELDAYLAQQLKAAGVSQPLFDETARQGLYQATKGIPRKVNKLAMTALRLAAGSKSQTVNEAILLDATTEAML